MIGPLANLPEHKRTVVEQLVGELSRVPGVAAIVLGGSYAAGTHHAMSDVDLGLYYLEAAPFAVAEIRRIAAAVSTQGAPTVTDFYGWGAWVNGGAWLHTDAGKVDLLYRNLDQVRRTIQEASEGRTSRDYDQQPPHGFYSVIYLAETHVCMPLFDPDLHLADLKRQVAAYPAKLKAGIVTDFLWSAEFTLLFARDFAAQGDVYNTVGCLTRIAANLTQVLFALNERYFMRDKRVMEEVATFPILPAAYVPQVTRLLAHPGQTAAELIRTVRDVEAVWHSVVALTEGQYQPKFQV